MHKYLLSTFFIFIILCFTINSATAKTYNTLLTNSTNSKLRLITYNDKVDEGRKYINFPNNIIFVDNGFNYNLIKFNNNHIENAVTLRIADIPTLTTGINFEEPYINDNNILISFKKSCYNDKVCNSGHYWYCSGGIYGSKYVFLTIEPIKISIDLNKVDTPIAVNTHGGYFYPFNQGQNRYLLFTKSLENLFKWRTVFYLYKENKNTNTFQYQGVIMAAHSANIIYDEFNDRTILQFDKNPDVEIKNGKIKYLTLGASINHTYHSFKERFDDSSAKELRNKDFEIEKADLTSNGKAPGTNISEALNIYNFPVVKKKYKDKKGNKYFISGEKNSLSFLVKINKNNTLAWIVRSNQNLSEFIVDIDEKNIKLKLGDDNYTISQNSELPADVFKKSHVNWEKIRYTDTPLVINNSI